MQFKTQFDKHERVHANPGNREKILYVGKVDENGVMDLVEAGKENLYDYIQSHKMSCDINVIMSRFARGDVSALSKRQGMFGDFTDAPSSYAEALNSMIVAESYFNSLPLETRAKFEHNFHKFLLAMDKPDFASILSDEGIVPPSVAVTPTVEPEGLQQPLDTLTEVK